MTFSIIVPVYNVKKFLQVCVESVFSQTYEKWNLVLVDDGSTDGCAELCDSFAERDTRVNVIHKPNGGLVSARKAGLQFATGDYTVCLDGDDFLAPVFLEKMNAICQSTCADAVLAGAIWYTDLSETKQVPIPFPAGLYNRDAIKTHFFPCLIEDEKGRYFPNNVWGRAWKTDLYKKYQLLVDDRIKIGEDAACTKPLLAACDSVYIIPDCLYYYRQNQASMTKVKKTFLWNGPKLIGEHYFSLLQAYDYDFGHQIQRNIVHNVFNVAVSAFYQEKSYNEVCRQMKTELQDPLYQEAINKAYFKPFTKGSLAHVALKHTLTLLMNIFSKIK